MPPGTTSRYPEYRPRRTPRTIVTLGKSETYKETIKEKSTILPYSIHKRIHVRPQKNSIQGIHVNVNTIQSTRYGTQGGGYHLVLVLVPLLVLLRVLVLYRTHIRRTIGNVPYCTVALRARYEYSYRYRTVPQLVTRTVVPLLVPPARTLGKSETYKQTINILILILIDSSYI